MRAKNKNPKDLYIFSFHVLGDILSKKINGDILSEKSIISLNRINQKNGGGRCFGEWLWWAARTSNPVDAARHRGSIPPLERFYFLLYPHSLTYLMRIVLFS